MNRDDWEKPYLPPGGLAPECLLPDGCATWNDPVMARPLEPLARFDRPQLKDTIESPYERDTLANLRGFMAKQCAGLAHEYRPDVVALREAFCTGRFTEQQAIALEWAFSGMREKYVFPGFVAAVELPIFEVVRCFWVVFDGAAFGCGPWLNQWADDPDKPHPATTRVPVPETVDEAFVPHGRHEERLATAPPASPAAD